MCVDHCPDAVDLQLLDNDLMINLPTATVHGSTPPLYLTSGEDTKLRAEPERLALVFYLHK